MNLKENSKHYNFRAYTYQTQILYMLGSKNQFFKEIGLKNGKTDSDFSKNVNQVFTF